jgi:hypothetical protein
MGYAEHLGKLLFDDAYQFMNRDARGARIESLVAMLASVGGHLCLLTILEALREEGRQPEDVGMIVMRGHDGHIYLFGDAPNRLLCEAPYSLISMVFGAAQSNGAPVTVEMIHDEMKKVARMAGKTDFLELELPAEHQVDTPLAWAHAFTPLVLQSMAKGGTPAFWRPLLIGFALQQAFDVGKQALDPLMMARIALGCAVRAAKIDPARVAAG